MSKIESAGEPVVVLNGHDGEVHAVDCAQIGGRPVAVTAGADGMLRVWDLAAAAPDGPPLSGHKGAVTSVACAVLDDRPVAVSGGEDGTLRVWDLDARTPTAPPVQHDEYLPVHGVVAARLDGRPIVLSAGPAAMDYDGEGGYYSGGLVRVWDLATGEPVGQPLPETEHTAGIACAEVDGRSVAAVSDHRRVRVFGLPDGEPAGVVFDRHDRMVSSAVAAVLDGRSVVVTGSGYTVWRWDPTDGGAIGEPLLDYLGSYEASVQALAVLVHNGRSILLAAGRVLADDTGLLRVFDLATGRQSGPEIRDRTAAISDVAATVVSGRPYAVVVGSDSVRLWDLTAHLKS